MNCHNCGPEGIDCDLCRGWKCGLKKLRKEMEAANEEVRRGQSLSERRLAEERARHRGEIDSMRQRAELAEKRLQDMTQALKRALAG